MQRTVYSLFGLLAIFSLIAVAPSAFGDHASVTVTNAPGSSTPGCEATNDCFIPSMVTIDVGSEVIWENTDNAAHTVTSGTPEAGPDGVFDSQLVMAGGSFSFMFHEAGSYDYFCMVHPWMQGMVMVSAEEEHGDEHGDEMKHSDEMGHSDDHASGGIEDISDQFTATVTSGVIHHIGANSDDDTLLVHLFGADDAGELKIVLSSRVWNNSHDCIGCSNS